MAIRTINYQDPMNVLSQYKPTTYTPNYPRLGEGFNNNGYNTNSNGNTYNGIYDSNAINTLGSTYANYLNNQYSPNIGIGTQSMMGYSPTLSVNNFDGTNSLYGYTPQISSTLGNFSGSNFSYGNSAISPNISLPNDLVNSGKSITELQNYKPSTGILPKNEDGSTNWFGNGGVVQGIQSIVGIGQSLFNMWQGYKQQKLMKEAFEETKRFNHANYQAMAKAHNANIRDQMSGRSTTLTSNAAKQTLVNNYRNRKIKEDY